MVCHECGHAKLIAGRCPNCGALVDASFAPPPQRLRGGPHWDDLFTLGLIAFVLTILLGAAVAALSQM